MTGGSIGLDFGTTNSVVALGQGGGSDLLDFAAPRGAAPVFRSALCFWHDDDADGGLASDAGPWAIAEYLEYPADSRFIQSFKTVAASQSFDQATIFGKRFRFEDLGRVFLDRMVGHAGGRLDTRPPRIVVGRPVEYAGSRPDEALARQRYAAMFEGFGVDIHYVYEPLGAAYSFAARLDEPATVLVADFGGGTSDFSVVRIGARGDAPRCVPLGHAGVGIAGDRLDYRLLDRLVLPMLGKGGEYRSFDKLLEIPRSWFSDFADWSRLALMRNPRTLAELERLRRAAVDGDAIARMIAVIEGELGYPLYEAVAQTKRALSTAEVAPFRFDGGGLTIEADVSRASFEDWIAEDVAQMERAVDRALAASRIDAAGIDRVFLTGGTSLVPRIRRIFTDRFGADRIESGGELTSIAHGLALIGQEEDVAAWSA
ncbi:Hsp70 family protein [Rhizorhabdus dicambivorans]|uniref:Hsp70 family protein n=1 Tax=Rhizorhabdus dicambivorans TaxID=1850238 RepID=A0A2A4FSQ9_9SPHN|nr:Hsp70 family protein [Rhizorhabdus dicambivorans]ATE64423.1 Hsp70 family protein [Rhizorhabdus dicambivorans]PCE41227.1 Hsp70 family protein [Rhizorhabdus dicambivorans]